MQIRSRTLLGLSLAFLSLSACGSSSGGASGLTSVDELLGWVERVYIDAELSRQEVKTSLSGLQTIATKDFEGDPIAAFKGFSDSILGSQEQAKKLRNSYQHMQRSAMPVFERWTDDLAQFSNQEIRRRSQERLDAARAKYDAVARAVGPLLSTYDRYNQGLKDYQLFLSNDFTTASVDLMQKEADKLVELANEIDNRLDSTLKVAKAYIETAELPTNLQKAAKPPSK